MPETAEHRCRAGARQGPASRRGRPSTAWKGRRTSPGPRYRQFFHKLPAPNGNTTVFRAVDRFGVRLTDFNFAGRRSNSTATCLAGKIEICKPDPSSAERAIVNGSCFAAFIVWCSQIEPLSCSGTRQSAVFGHPRSGERGCDAQITMAFAPQRPSTHAAESAASTARPGRRGLLSATTDNPG